jgi:hypothetical protein
MPAAPPSHTHNPTPRTPAHREQGRRVSSRSQGVWVDVALDGEEDVVLELISGANYSRGQEVFIRCVCDFLLRYPHFSTNIVPNLPLTQLRTRVQGATAAQLRLLGYWALASVCLGRRRHIYRSIRDSHTSIRIEQFFLFFGGSERTCSCCSTTASRLPGPRICVLVGRGRNKRSPRRRGGVLPRVPS